MECGMKIGKTSVSERGVDLQQDAAVIYRKLIGHRRVGC